MRAFRTLPLLLIWISTPAFGLSAGDISGVYKYDVKTGINLGPKEREILTVENILELVKVGDDAMYFKTKLYFNNGHQCSIFGVARLDKNQLQYKKDSCSFKIKIASGEIMFEDIGEKCLESTCGARGNYSSAKFLLKQRRNIKYMKRLKDSDDFKQALKNYAR